MSIKFNPLIFGGFDISGTTPAPSGAVEWKSPVATESALPTVGNTDGDARVALDTDKIYVWDAATSKWIDSKLTAAALGSTPNADGITVSSVTVGDITRSTINLEPADSTNPGAVSTSAQNFAGDKTFDDLVTASSGVETDSIDTITAGAGTLSIGTANASTINIGDSGVNVNLYGNTFYQDVTNLEVTDKQITLNKDGAAASAFNSGIELEEAGSVTGYVSTSGDRNSWELKAPNQAGVATINPGASGITLDQSSHDPVTLGAVGSTPNADGATLTGQVLNLEPADSSNPGVVTVGTQSFGGDKTFDNNVTVVGSIDAQTGIDASTGTLKLGQANTTTVYLGDYDGGNTTSIEVAANINGNGYNIDNVGLLTNVGAFSAVPTGNDSVNVSISTNTGSGIGSDSSNILFTESNPFDSQILYIAGGHLAVTATTDITIDSPVVNLGQIGGTTTAYGDVVLDSPNVDIGQAGGTTDIVGTVTIEYNPADPTDWAPAPNDVIEAIDQLAERFVEQDQVTKEPTGFPNRTDSVTSVVGSTFTIDVNPPATSYDFYVKGKKFTKTTAINLTIPSLAGNHYIYFNDSGILSSTQTLGAELFENNALVSVVYWNTDTNSRSYFAEERHGLTMDGATHTYLHTVFGARYLSGLALQNFNVDGTGNSPADAQFDADEGKIRDEDILIEILPQAQIPILFRQGQLWRKKSADAYPVIYSGTAGYTGANGRLPYNEFTGGSWQLTEVTNNDYVLVHFFATNDKDAPVVGIQGINKYTTINAARNAASTEISSLSGLPFAEFVALGSVVFETANGYTNVPKARTRSVNGGDYVDFRGTQLYTPAGEATTHSLLSGLGNDDHIQYLLASGTRTMSGALDMGTHQINNVVDPSLAQDAATKNYVDSEITSAITGTASYFAGFDPTTGLLTEVPGYTFDDSGSLQIGAQNSITIPAGVTDYISIGISPNVSNPGLTNLSAIQVNSPIDQTVSTYSPIQVFGYGTSAPTNFNAYNSQTNYTGVGSNITHYLASGSSDCTGAAVGFRLNGTGDAGTIQGVSLTPSGDATTIEGVSFIPSGTYTDATGLTVDLSSATITNRPVGLDITGGSLNSSLTFSTVSNLPSIVDSGNVIRPVFEVEAGSPITETDVLMSNLAGFMDIKDDYSGSTALGLGVASVGFVSQVAVASGKTASNVSMLTTGLAVDSTSAGGTITDAHLIRAFSSNFGGTLNIGTIYGLQVESGISSLATNSFGISIEDSGADNYLAKSLTIGGITKTTTNNEIAIEIGSNKSIRVGLATTAQRTALANLSGLVIYDTDLNKFFGNDGSQWFQLNLSIGDIDQTSFPASDNQSSAANITSFAFSNAVTRGFEAVVTIERASTYAEYTLKGIQKSASWEMSQDYIGDDTGITFNITSSGQIQYTSTSTGSGATIKFRAKTV